MLWAKRITGRSSMLPTHANISNIMLNIPSATYYIQKFGSTMHRDACFQFLKSFDTLFQHASFSPTLQEFQQLLFQMGLDCQSAGSSWRKATPKWMRTGYDGEERRFCSVEKRLECYYCNFSPELVTKFNSGLARTYKQARRNVLDFPTWWSLKQQLSSSLNPSLSLCLSYFGPT